ncbi:5'-nucleotidase C-terminal domain-containing protein [Paraburkholderia acidipaludis]|uniref:5'-nucleotidase C-terminal domain-containing protein n=1 Tax=Paraburkholderia acidipaludis TaxID=660537 RepID=UPI000A4D8C81|nr:bifunctional metallophosphatase/5'-nucleotidase [Paraburkholderia acidipaludis]
MNNSIRYARRMAIFPQINDFYHIDSCADPTDPASMLLPRVAEVVRRLRVHYDDARVIFCLPGDFLHPSWLSRIHHGAQMVDVLMEAGVDVVTLGNHEFDFDPHFTPAHLIEAITRSGRMTSNRFAPGGRKITWMASNRLPWESSRVQPPPETREAIDRLVLPDALYIRVANDHVIALFGLMKDGCYEGFFEAGDSLYRCADLIRLAKNEHIDGHGWVRPSDFSFVAMTHQDLDVDRQMVDRCPQVRLVIGGHDHEVEEPENRPTLWNGEPSRSLIVKAKSNARTMCVSFVNWFPASEASELFERYGGMEGAVKMVGKFNLDQMLRTMLLNSPDRLKQGGAVFRDLQDDVLRDVRKTLNAHVFDNKSGGLAGFTLDGSWTLDMQDARLQKLVVAHAPTKRRIEHWLALTKPYVTDLVEAPCTLVIEDSVVRRRSSNFGNFVADVVSGRQLARGGNRQIVDIGLVNAGSFRIQRNIAKGEMMTTRTLGDIFLHDNRIVVFPQVPGETVRKMIELTLTRLGARREEGDGHFLQISGLAVRNRAGGSPEIFVQDGSGARVALQNEQTYRVATTAYLATNAASPFKMYFDDLMGADAEPCIRTAVERELLALGRDLRLADEDRWLEPDRP